MNAYRVFEQSSSADSPWGVGIRVRVLLWELCWALLCAWTPKPFNGWRLLWLRAFGARIDGRPFVHGRARVVRPWNLSMQPLACIGDGAVAYCLDRIEMREGSTLAQGAYVCTGTHDFDDPSTPLKTAPITIGERAFVGLRALILPGVDIAPGTLVGAGAVVARDTEPWGIYAGNPARRIGTRRPT